MIPSAESSCILVQADTIFMLRESTTSTRHSILPNTKKFKLIHVYYVNYIRTWLLVVIFHGVPNDIVHNTCSNIA